MKIAYLTPTYPPYPGGIGMAAAYLAREMGKQGHDVTVFTPQYNEGTESQETLDGVRVHFLKPVLKYGNAGFLPQLRTHLRDFDVVHCYYPFFGGLEVAAYARARGARFALVIHHEMDTVGEGMLRQVFAAHEKYLMPHILKNTDAFAALSQDYLDHSPFAAMLKKTNTPITVIPNGVDVEKFKSTRNDRSLHDIPRLVLVAGLDRAHYFKGVPHIIRAVKILKDRGTNVSLTVVGDGDMRKEYEQLARITSLTDRVTFTGLVNHDALPALLDRQDMFVMPSTAKTESFCIAAAEAQSVGLPAIVSDLPGLRQTIGIGETGEVFPVGNAEALADAIARLTVNPDAYRAYSQRARVRMVEKFSWQHVADAATAAYETARAHRGAV